ncbi:PREDICTED: uncharacterized protein LOC108363086 [Rhagoletis zephyria]|uniref:uncharacterized protein LOC108363086 n=1 Tax=Rhagoletis zephyria TaxID=28612 RepID=UPI0008117E41|nr:PREDICTED: uncharacterized protein LOC108363086 [Rhagoletis zephyria]
MSKCFHMKKNLFIREKEFLINYLEDNVDIANDKFVAADGAKFREEKWKELAVSLNGLGGTQEDGAKWKKKYSAIRQAEQSSGINGLSRAKALLPLEFLAFSSSA